MHWNDERLAALPIDQGFRLRGAQVTRIEALTDGAFALALTFLVIVQQEIPKDFSDLMLAFRQTPVFAASFSILILFWSAHVRWSRRYGLEDGPAVALSALLIFTMLVFVYPLKIVFGAFFSSLTGGWVPGATRFQSHEQLQTLFIIYGAGFVLMQATLVGLYADAARRADALRLNALERFDTRADARGHALSLGIAAFATLLALLLPARWSPWSGYSYGLFAVLKPWYWQRVLNRRAALQASESQATSAELPP
ncbi:TMEM175 family protein [Nevskia sp.]|uniref:TMEM175 family protein n=1 Tax=Nevskia sp. TaxID=1929292 RepID=UPI0025D75A79|nr:TMEM175 family protein [Nevskia sp.]